MSKESGLKEAESIIEKEEDIPVRYQFRQLQSTGTALYEYLQ